MNVNNAQYNQMFFFKQWNTGTKAQLESIFPEWNEFVMFFFYLYCVGVRLDRVRGGRQKYKRTVDSGPIVQQIFPMIKKACVESTKSGINPKTAKSSAQNIMLHPHLYFK